MKTLLGIFLLAFLGAHAQVSPPKPPEAGRGGAQTPPAASAKGPTTTAAMTYRDLKFPPLRVIKEPAGSNFTLANGMKLLLVEDHDLPTVSGLALVRTGGLLDPPERIGLAQLVGIAMRTGGTNVKSGEQIDSLLDDVAATADVAINEAVGAVSFSGLKEHTPATLQLFKEILTQPGFRSDRFEVAKAQLRSLVAQRNDNPAGVAHRELSKLVYGKDTPSGWQPEYATIDRITRANARSFHQQYFFPANVMLAVWGDFNTAEMKSAIEQLFADWKAPQAAAPEFPKVVNKPAPGIYLAELKNAPQTYFSIGHLGGLRDSKDYPAMIMLTAILGNGPQSRIGDRLRNKLGVPNEVSANWNAGMARPGLFEISGSTKSIATNATIQAVRDEIQRIRTEEVTDDEWRSARDAAVNSLVFAHDSLSKFVSSRIVLDYYGYPKDYLPKSQQALQSVTRADLLRVAKQYLDPANLTIVVAANPSLLGDPLDKLGPVTKLDVTIPEARPEVRQTTEATIAQGKQILAKAQAAAGGVAKLSAVKDYTMMSEFLIDPAVPNLGGSKIIQLEKWMEPTVFRQEATLPTGRVTAYTDGKIGWLATSQGWTGLSGVQRTQALSDLFRVYYKVLLSDRLEGRTVNAIEDSTVQITDTTGQVCTVEFDSQTFQLRRISYDLPQVSGPPLYAEDIFDDFRDVGGIKVPFKFTINQGGRRFADAVVKDYKVNTGLNPTEVARRPQ